MRVFCAWCGRLLGIVISQEPAAKGALSHGICEECLERVVEEEHLRDPKKSPAE